jgi:hypothetical protein
MDPRFATDGTHHTYESTLQSQHELSFPRASRHSSQDESATAACSRYPRARPLAHHVKVLGRALILARITRGLFVLVCVPSRGKLMRRGFEFESKRQDSRFKRMLESDPTLLRRFFACRLLEHLHSSTPIEVGLLHSSCVV